MAKGVQFNKEFKNHRVSIFNGDSVETYRVADIFSDQLEFENGVLPLCDAKKYYDVSAGGVHYVYNLDLPAKVESESLKRLRRSTAIHNIFSFDKKKPFNLLGFMPWVALILMILFHK